MNEAAMQQEPVQQPCPCGSLKSFAQCHGAAQGVPLIEPQKPELHVDGPTLKLDLAAGQSPKDGFEGVDVWPQSKHVVDLTRFPWPWADSSVAEVYCSHFIEHLPMQHVDPSGNYVQMGAPGAQDLLFKFFDEVWRVLVPHGWATIVVPNAFCVRGYQDPTHRRFIVAETFLYLHKPWRVAQKLDHYNVTCDFDGGSDPTAGHVVPIILSEANAWHDEVRNRRFTHEINRILDWQAKLRACK